MKGTAFDRVIQPPLVPTFERLLVALGEEEHRLCGALGRLEQALAARVLAEVGQQRAVHADHVRQERFPVQQRRPAQVFRI